MRKIKKMIASLTAAMLLFSFAAPAMAADTTTAAVTKAVIGKDVKGTKYEKDALKLISLGIVKGFEDGTVRPDATVTRAQFAAIVCQELGIAADAGQSTTKFKDVPASHWASGVINLAVGKGIIYGFGDGTFKPDAPVTYAQAYAMLVQMLGWGPAVKDAAWPAGVLAKAASVGVSTGVKGSANAEMKRGDVIIAGANSLEADRMDQSTWGSDNNYTKADKTLLEEVFELSTVDAEDGDKRIDTTVDKVPMIAIGDLDPDEINIDGKTFTLSDAYNPNDFLGQSVEYWVDDNDKIFYIAGSDDQKVVTDKIVADDSDLLDAKQPYLHIDKADDDIDVDAAAKVWVNIDDTQSDLVDINVADYDDATIKAVMEGNKVVYAAITTFNTGNYGLVSEVDAKDETIDFDGGTLTSENLDDYDYVVVKDGVNATLADVKAGDIVNILYNDADDAAYVVATSTQVKGAADISWDGDSADITNYTVTLNDVEYDVDAAASYSDDNNDTVADLTDTDLKDINGEDVTVYLDAKGDIAHIVSGDVESTKLVGVVSEAAFVDDANPARVKVEFKLTNTKGTELDFEFDPADVKINDVKDKDGSDWNALVTSSPVLVEYKLDSAGELTNLDVVTGEYDDITFDSNEDDKTITVTAGDLDGDFQVNDKTVIVDVNDPTDVKVATWDNIKSKEDLSALAEVDDNVVKSLFVYAGGALTSDTKYAVVTGLTTKGTDKDPAVKLLLPDGSTDVVVSDGATVTGACYGTTTGDPVQLAKGQFISYELNSDGEIDTAVVLAKADSAVNGDYVLPSEIETIYQGTVTDVKSGSIYIGGSAKTINSGTKVLNIADTTALKAGGSVSKGDYVIYIDSDDDNRTADYVVIITED